MTDGDTRLLIEWIRESKIDGLTGYWGNDKPQWRKVAEQAGAIGSQPFAQYLNMHRLWFRLYERGHVVTHPSFYMFFGTYNGITLANADTIPPEFPLGWDLEQELLDPEDVPEWVHNSWGDERLTHLGQVKTKNIKMTAEKKDWLPHLVQTCVWLGSSRPSKNNLVG